MRSKTKTVLSLFIAILLSFCIIGCGDSNRDEIMNSVKAEWKSCDSLKEAEDIAGFTFALPYDENEYLYNIRAFEGMIEIKIDFTDISIAFRKSVNTGNIFGYSGDAALEYKKWENNGRFSDSETYVGVDKTGLAYTAYFTDGTYGYFF